MSLVLFIYFWLILDYKKFQLQLNMQLLLLSIYQVSVIMLYILD